MTDLAGFDTTIELRVLYGLTGGTTTPAADYAAQLIRVHARTLAALDEANRRIEALRQIAGRDAAMRVLATYNDIDDADLKETADVLADQHNDLEAPYAATAGEVDQYHAWREGTLPEDRDCEPDCGACQILANVPPAIRAAADVPTPTNTGVHP